MFHLEDDFRVEPRGTRKAFPVELAADGTPCLLGDTTMKIENSINIIGFPVVPRNKYRVDENIVMYELIAGDFIGVYEVTENRLIIRSYYVESINNITIETILADTLIMYK